MNNTINQTSQFNRKLIRKVGIYRILQETVIYVVRDHYGRFCLGGTLQQCFNFINCKTNSPRVSN